MNPIFPGKVENQTLVLDSPNKFREYLFTLNDKRVDIVVGVPKKQRSNQQNKWYWACVVGIAAEHFGYLPEEMHDCYKLIFLRMHEEGKPDTIRSTTTLSTKEFKEYTEKCQQWAAEQGLIIPNPDEVLL